MTKAIKLRVNGGTHRLDTDPDAPLLQILRNNLGLKAAKFGCGLEQCGACKVLIDGQAAPSCAMPVSAIGDAEITTLEGLGTPADLHPLQRAFIAEQAAQGTISDGNNHTTYWALQGGQLFGATEPNIGQPKSPTDYTIVGQSLPRLDLPAKIAGTPSFVHDLELPDMVHGRVVRPPTYAATLATLDEGSVADLSGVLAIIRDGSFIGVLAEREEQAEKAAAALRQNARWYLAPLPSSDTFYTDLLAKPSQDFLVVDGVPQDGPVPPIEAPPRAVQTLDATYYRPYHMHAALGPAAAAALWQDDHLKVWSHTQGAYPLRGSLASALGLADEQVRVLHCEGPGCYGHNGADDVALDAALLARALPGRPVLLKWSRADEHAWEAYGWFRYGS